MKLQRGFSKIEYDHNKGRLVIDGIDYSGVSDDIQITIKPFQCEVDMHVKLIAKKDDSFAESPNH